MKATVDTLIINNPSNRKRSRISSKVELFIEENKDLFGSQKNLFLL